ncbi:hypothetical protein PoB_003541300 [Plakobranchus ocellatus]|uniref:Uncharacterized protein n=1 Tax=Plakobranchus ocellatus TaxID=259542 RepID=A0AAV4AQR7_9GAST|nr:hypothetical protein PoB_003541300 [Plakobranchus ocellatus]
MRDAEAEKAVEMSGCHDRVQEITPSLAHRETRATGETHTRFHLFVSSNQRGALGCPRGTSAGKTKSSRELKKILCKLTLRL